MNTFKGRQLRELARRRELLYFKRTGVKKIAFPLVIASRNTICCTGAWRINLSKYSFMPVRSARNAAQSSQKDDERRFQPATIYPDTKRRLSRSFTCERHKCNGCRQMHFIDVSSIISTGKTLSTFPFLTPLCNCLRLRHRHKTPLQFPSTRRRELLEENISRDFLRPHH